MRHEVTLSELARAVDGRVVGNDASISNVEHDSRRVEQGTLFVAIRGFAADGHGYVEHAVASGAAAVCIDHQLDLPTPQLIVDDTRLALGPISATLYDHPSTVMPVIGITGTNGKTTITHLLEAIGNAAGLRSAVIGTIGARISGERIPLERTTPEASELQKLFAEMCERHVELVAMEVSSHSLALHRVDGTRFEVVAFTNLSQDHLDFHKDMDTYFAAKAQLFTREFAGRAVVFVDDPYGSRLASTIDLPLTTVGLGEHSDIRAESVVPTVTGTSFVMITEEGSFPVELPLGGTFNVTNALIAAGCAREAGIPMERIVAGLESVQPVRGRFEVVSGAHPVSVIVDYAHTPDGIRAVVDAARKAADGRVTVVLGAGGDRDHGKRPSMGAAASSADTVIVTSDNPRSEDPAAIAAAVVSGVTSSDAVVELDREAAIFDAVNGAEPGDVVLILGKGHETTQTFKDRTVPFDDREVARRALEARS